MRVAVVHDWLVTYAGAERVLEQMLECVPGADLFAVVDFLPDEDRTFLKGKSVNTSFVQRLPFARTKYRSYLPLMPLAIEQLDVSGYDLVISSSHAVAKGVLTGPDQLHVCMCYSPIRYAWDLQHQYLKESGIHRGLKSWIARKLLHDLRIWDVRTANGVDHFVAISRFIARRISKTYRRDSVVIYPPVDVEHIEPCDAKEDFYLTASRLVPYKRVDLIVEAFAAMPDKKLVVIGDGPEMTKIRRLSTPNVEIMGYRETGVLRERMRRAKAFIFAAEEDFGITPLEAQACGTPVIAYGKGGAVETIRCLTKDARPTGLLFPEQTAEAVRKAVESFESRQAEINPAHCRENAERFSTQRFREEFSGYVEALVGERFGSMP